MTLSAAEQFLLELINRARLNPAAEAARHDIALNQGLNPGTISTAAKQVLAPNALLEAAATAHTLWMLDTDIFSHTGVDGSAPGDRTADAGYPGTFVGENIAFTGTTGSITVAGAIEELYTNLFMSAGHRANTMLGSFREVGLGAEVGVFRQGGTSFNAAMLTENFGTSGTAHFLTGVAYADSNRDKFYSMGEGRAGVVFEAQGQQTTTAAAGGYALALRPGVAVAVTGHSATVDFSLTVNLRPGNVKLDLVGDRVFHSSGSLTLGTGIQDVVLLGVARLNATGTALDNNLTGNFGANTLSGLGGRDVLSGGAGNDTIAGGGGNDTATGGKGADTFVLNLGEGVDRITDFSVAAGDGLRLNNNLWQGQTLTAAQVVSQFASVVAGEVVFDFGVPELHLTGLTSTTGLTDLITII